MSGSLPMVLIVLDGWGHREETRGNAIKTSAPRFMEWLGRTYPSGLLAASGEAVGLPPGFIGNSEVGHLCLGSGRTILQDLARIDRDIRTGGFVKNAVLCRALDAVAARSGAALHLLGLLSDGGVHSHIGHLEALLLLARERGVRRTFVHAFLDGRDTPPRSSLGYVRRLESFLSGTGAGSVASVAGRYYAMDRDNRWERTEQAFRALVERNVRGFGSASEAVQAGYAAGQSDEFVEPVVVGDEGAIRDGDTVVFFNFRADRARQLTRAFTEAKFEGFRAPRRPELAEFVCFTTYDRAFGLPVVFPPQHHRGVLGEVVSASGLPQLRIAETEKYAHVTYFFNGGEERPFPGEERCLIPSPKVATYDRQPRMSAPEVTAEVTRRLGAKPRQVVILNYANADMVGHTGQFEPTVEACRLLDRCVEAVVRETLRLGGCAVVTADHGKAEEMIDEATGEPVTAHTRNPVPVHVAGAGLEGKRLREGGLLGDVAPTILGILGIPQSSEMEGRSLLLG